MAAFVSRAGTKTMRGRCGLMISTTLLVGSAEAAEDSLLLRRLDRNALRSVTSPAEDSLTPDAAAPVEKGPAISLTVGVASDHQQQGERSLSTPFYFNVLPGSWDLSLLGDGYKRVTAGGATRSGAADLSLQAGYLWKVSQRWAIEPFLGLTMPTHGETGSKSGSEGATLVTSFELHGWKASLTGALSRADRAETGSTRYSNSVAVKVQRSFNETQRFFVLTSRDKSGGSPGSYTVTAEYDFGIVHGLGGQVVFARGLSAGGRNRLVEFDLVHDF